MGTNTTGQTNVLPDWSDGDFSIKDRAGDTLLTLAASGTTFSQPVTVGVDDTGYNVKYFGATSGCYMEWDESADELDLAGTLTVTGPAKNPINADSISAYTTAGATGTLGNVIKTNLSGSVTHTATTVGLTVKNYADGVTINGNYELSGIIGYLKHKATLSGGAKSSLMSLHRHGSSTGTVDYGIRVFTADTKLTTLFYASGTMTNFFEAVADGSGGATVGTGMTKDPETDQEDAYLTIDIAGTSYQVPAYAA